MTGEEFPFLTSDHLMGDPESLNHDFEEPTQLEVRIDLALIVFLPKLHRFILVTVPEDGVGVLRRILIPPPKLAQQDCPYRSATLPPILIDLLDQRLVSLGILAGWPEK